MSRKEITENTRLDKTVNLGIIDKSTYKKLDEKQQEAGFDFDEIFVISTNSKDREGDIIDQVWRLQNYNQEVKGEKSGPVLVNHNSMALPVGKGFAWLEDGKLMSGVKFANEIDEYEIGKIVAELVRQNFLKNASVGFIPHNWEKMEDEGPTGWPSYRFTDNELLEWSVVNVPANPDAQRKMISKGIDLKRLEKAGIIEMEKGLEKVNDEIQELKKKLEDTKDELQKEKDVNEGRKPALKAYRKYLKMFKELMQLSDLNDEVKSIDQVFGILFEKFSSQSEETPSDAENQYELSYDKDSDFGKAIESLKSQK